MGTEYHIENPNDGKTTSFYDLKTACEVAVGLSIATGNPVNIDIIFYSMVDAELFGGDDAKADYLDDPDASVSKRITINAQDMGRIA